MIIKAILLMGGEGHRFESEIPKQFLALSGKAVYQHALELFLSFSEIEEVIVVVNKKWMAYVEKEVGGDITLVEGGRTRKHSSYCGLLACGPHTDAVIIHDAVRPLVSREIVRGHIDALSNYQAINTCIPSTDTMVYSAHPGSVDHIPDRSLYWRGQTPQSFAYPLILEAHRKAELPVVHDDCALVLALGHPVHLLPGSEDNIKITFLTDLFLAEQFLRLRSQSFSLGFEGSLEGKIFAITGGTGGIGAAIARSLDREGAISLILSQSSKEYRVDLTRCEETQRVFQEIFSHHGWLDGLINCTGFLRIKPFHQLKFHEIDEMISSNLFSVLYSCRAAQIKPGGHIINFSSSSFSRGRKSYVLYSSSKAAILNFTQGLAEERPDLRVNAIIPQRTNTSMRRANFPGEDPSTLLLPEEVADGVLSLLKDGRMTGSFIEVRKK